MRWSHRIHNIVVASCAIALVTAAGCGTTEVADLGESSLDVFPIDVGIDSGGEKDNGAVEDTGTDTGGGDVAGDECLSKYDCKEMKGLTPCSVPACDNGYCKVEARPEGSTCVDPLVVLDVCQESKCNAKAECEAVSRPDGAGCTDKNVAVDECQTTTCSAGKCTPSNKEDGNVCGIGACTRCKAGKCATLTAGDLDDGNPCTNDSCDPNSGEVHDKITDLTVPCDDGKKCTGEGNCVLGVCEAKPLDCDDGISCTVDLCDEATGCTHKGDDKKCTDDDPCVNVACSLSAGCTTTTFNDGAKCDDGNNDCTKDDLCTKTGACVGTPTCGCNDDSECLDKDGKHKNPCKPEYCKKEGKTGFCVVDLGKAVTCADDGGECADHECDPKTGECDYFAKNDSKDCDDFNKCTDKSTCKDAACVGQVNESKCDDKNPCTLDSCEPSAGCVQEPASGTCDDGNPCTSDDVCIKGGCGGTAKACDDGVSCTKDSCDAETGKCINTVDAKLCDDGKPCTKDVCDTESATLKGCKNTPDDKGKCDDGDKCTIDGCKSGQCVATGYDKTKPGCGCVKDTECNDKNPCTVDKCDKGDCKYDPKGKEGAKCETGDVCHVAASGVCQAGACSGGKPKDCSGSADKCHTAQCNKKTGKCDKLQKKDGTACDADGDKCTVNDACNKGQCTKGQPKECTGGDQCNNMACDSKTGGCAKKPKKSGTPCEDSNICTDKDACDGKGACKAGPALDCSKEADQCNNAVCDQGEGCVKVSKGTSVKCNDGKFCTKIDVCVVKTVNKRKVGTCTGSGVPDCKADANKCQVAFCDAKAGKCAIKAAPAGVTCSDGNKCTLVDRCDTKGVCKAGSPKTCKGDQCNTPVCTPSTGACSLKPKAKGTKCSDGNLCTQTDTCSAGKCNGANPKKCSGDQCNDGACNPGNGACYKKPKKNGTACNDGQTCTKPDTCQSGTCKAGTWTCGCKVHADCDDKKACTTDQCLKNSSGAFYCKYTPKTGTSCTDGNACTLSDKCDSGGNCKGSVKNCNDGNVCTLDSCDSKSGKCLHNSVAASCSDNNKCTSGDKCVGSVCKGSSIVCNDKNGCTNDSCNPKTGCTFVANSNTCNKDNNACTVGDKCVNKVCTAGPKKSCSDGTICTSDSCNTSTGKCSNPTNSSYAHRSCEKGSYSGCNGSKCQCQNWTATVGSTSTGYYEYLYDIKRDGDYTVGVGYRYRRYTHPTTKKTYYYYYGFAAKMDRYGKRIWERTYYTGDTQKIRRFYGLTRNTKDKRWVAVGYTYNGTSCGYDGWIVEFDDNGSQRRNYVVRPTSSCKSGDVRNDYLRDVVMDKNGEYYAVGYSQAFSYNVCYYLKYKKFSWYETPWIVKLKKNGSSSYSVVWHRARSNYYNSGRYYGVAYNSYRNSAIAVGYTSIYSGCNVPNNGYPKQDKGKLSTQALVSVWPSSGSSAKHVTWGKTSTQILYDVATYSSYYHAVGSDYISGSSTQGLRLAGYTSSGAVTSSKHYGGTSTDTFKGITCVQGSSSVTPQEGRYCYSVGYSYDTSAKKYKTWVQYHYYSTATSTYKDSKFDVGSSYIRPEKAAIRDSSELALCGTSGSQGWIAQTAYNTYGVCK